jgi:hypothetical protein
MIMGHWRNNTDRGKPEIRGGGGNLSRWNFVNHKTRIDYKVIKITVKHNLIYYPDNRVSLLIFSLLRRHVSTVQAVIIRSIQKACYKSTMT